MQLIRVEKPDYELFEGLDPTGIMKRAQLNRGFVVAAVEQDDKSGIDEILGMVVCTENTDSLIIEWLAVDEDRQGQGVGDEIIYQLSLLANQARKKSLKVYISAGALGEIYTQSAIEYFADHGFSFSDKLAGELACDMYSFSKEFGNCISKCPSWLVSEHNIQTVKAREYAEVLSEKQDCVYGFNNYMVEEGNEVDLSYFLLGDKDHVKGALLVELVENTIYPSFFYADNEDTALLLLGNLSLAVREKYGSAADQMSFCMIAACEKAGLLEELLPGEKTDSCYMTRVKL